MPDLPTGPVPLPSPRLDPNGLPRAKRVRGKCDCGEPLRRFVKQATRGSMEVEELGLRCPRCKLWFKRITVYDREVHELIADPRPVASKPVIGELEI